jgi:hypothetical protein
MTSKCIQRNYKITIPKILYLPTEFSIGIYTIIPSAINLLMGSWMECFVGNFLFVGKFVSNKKIFITNRFTDGKSTPKTNYLIHSVDISLRKLVI